jgi:hypothetical protein
LAGGRKHLTKNYFYYRRCKKTSKHLKQIGKHRPFFFTQDIPWLYRLSQARAIVKAPCGPSS